MSDKDKPSASNTGVAADGLGAPADIKARYVVEARPDAQRGYPELWWHGRRAFRGVDYFPAQHKETHGDAVPWTDPDRLVTKPTEWRNQLFWGDNLQVMGHLLRKYRGQVKLIYIDPPFDSKADYKKRVQVRGETVDNDRTGFEEKQYGDIWNNDEYLQFMYERLWLLKGLLHPTGSIFIHLGIQVNHYLRIMCEEVFGGNNLVSEIVWAYGSPSGGRAAGTKLVKIQEYVLHFARDYAHRTENKVYLPYSDRYIHDWFRHDDGDGRKYQVRQRGRAADGNVTHERQYLDESPGVPASTVWTDIQQVYADPRAYKDNQGGHSEITDYPTQKPERLLERVLLHASNPGDLVFDCFMGSGTTQAVAMKLGRRFIGADINLGAIQTTTDRLIKVARELKAATPSLLHGTQKPIPLYTGFEVHTVNQYDLFRNEADARGLLMDALAIRPIRAGGLWDGTMGEEPLDRHVKFMPMNRIANKEDITALIHNMAKGGTFAEMRANLKAHPNKHALRVTLVCMGHDPALAGELEREIRLRFDDPSVKLDIEVCDILRDKTHIQIKRPTEADIFVKDGQLVIKSFYPGNLLQKLSLENIDVKDWRDLADSVFIDWNWDGSVLTPGAEGVTDIPAGKNRVQGTYSLPKKVGKIRVKITDVLSEVYEQTVEVTHGR